MRKVFFILICLLVIYPILAIPVFAQESANSSTLPIGETSEKDYLAANETVIISGTVMGDAYIAGGSLTIDGTITNDLIAGGGNLLITGDVNGDVRVAGGNVTFSGAKVGGNITVLGGQIIIDNSTSVGGSIAGAGGNIQILSPVPGEINIAGGNIVIGNTVGGDVNAATGELSIASNASVAGDLTYWSENEANISSTASISGLITREAPPSNYDEKVDEKKVAAGITGALFFIKLFDSIMLLIVGLIFIALFPIYADKVTKQIKSNFGMSLLLGLAAVILIPIVSLIIALTLFGIPLSIFIIALYLAMIWFVKIFSLLIIGRFILDKTNNTKKGYAWALIIGTVIYFILGLLPIISFFVDIVIVLAGTGGFIATKKSYYSELRSKKII